MYECPHCQRAALSFSDKLFLRPAGSGKPAAPARCSHCRGPVGVSDAHALMSLAPLAAGMAAAAFAGSVLGSVACFVAGFALYCFVFTRFVPIIDKAPKP